MSIFGTGYDPALMLLLNQRPSQAMANELTSNVSSAGRGAESALTKAQREFLRAVQAGQLGFDAGVDEATALQRMGSSYSGPNSMFDFEGFDANEFIEQASEAERNANMLGSSGGIFELLRDEYGAADVMPLDVAMAQHAGGKKFAQVKDEYDDILDMFGDTLKSTEEKAWDARVASQNSAMQYRDLYGQKVAQRQAAEKAAFEAQQAKMLAEWQAAQAAAARTPQPVYTPPTVPQHPGFQPTFQPTFQTPYAAPKPASKPAPKPAPKKPAAPKPTSKPVVKKVTTAKKKKKSTYTLNMTPPKSLKPAPLPPPGRARWITEY